MFATWLIATICIDLIRATSRDTRQNIVDPVSAACYDSTKVEAGLHYGEQDDYLHALQTFLAYANL